MKHSPPLVCATPSRKLALRSSQLFPPWSSRPNTTCAWNTKPGTWRNAPRTCCDRTTSRLQSSPRNRHVIHLTRSCPSRPALTARFHSRPEISCPNRVRGCCIMSGFCISTLSISRMTRLRACTHSSTLSAMRSSISKAVLKSTSTVSIAPPADLAGAVRKRNSTSPFKRPCSLASASPPRMVPWNSALQRASKVSAMHVTSWTSFCIFLIGFPTSSTTPCRR
mmetsp:Transcript_26157/g.68828  ORF Transcript_26157/g.68828 Transcript_26157/m.68828 type:complete len:223 (-) Transcript_26157:619-1287(-)